MKIGIGLTEFNRPLVFRHAYSQIIKFAPLGAKIVVVDDGSDEPLPEATVRLERNQGIAKAKNRCLEELADCDHIFLFDSDCYPTDPDWWRPYVESPEPHLMYIYKDYAHGQKMFDSVELYRDSKLKAYSHPRGVMLYFERRVLDLIGGYDTRYARWGYEHVDISNRIYNAGLTSFRFADVVGSEKLIHSGDEWQEVQGTVGHLERRTYLAALKPLFDRSLTSKEYCEYRRPAVGKEAKTNVVLTTYTVGTPDPQRGQWPVNYEDTKELRQSLEKFGRQLVILNDCLDESDTDLAKHVRIETTMNPYFQRWLSWWQYLRDHPEIDQVWCVDGTDVEMLRDPFPEMDDRLYVGDEPCLTNIPWMRMNHRHQKLLQFFYANKDKTLLNAGLTGGTRKTVMDFAHAMLSFYYDNRMLVGNGDMGTFNYVARNQFPGLISHGRQTSTVFKTFDRANSTGSFWRHK